MTRLKLTIGLSIVAGLLGLAYGAGSRTAAARSAGVGSDERSITNPESEYLPVWGSVGAIVAGGVLMASRRKAELRPVVL